MRLYQLAIVLVVLVVLREVSAHLIFRFIELGILANFGSLAIASFLAGWLASSIGTRPPTNRQLGVLAALGIIARLLIGSGRLDAFLALVAPLIFVIHTPISYVCLILGAKLAEAGTEVPSPGREGGLEATHDVQDV